MKEELITFDTAKLAKEKGFDWNVGYAYSKGLHQVYNSSIYENMNSNDIDDMVYSNAPYYSAPTQSLLQKWLREVHAILLYVENSNGKWNWAIVTSEGYQEGKPYKDEYYPLFEEVLEVGLFEALKLIKT